MYRFLAFILHPQDNLRNVIPITSKQKEFHADHSGGLRFMDTLECSRSRASLSFRK